MKLPTAIRNIACAMLMFCGATAGYAHKHCCNSGMLMMKVLLFLLALVFPRNQAFCKDTKKFFAFSDANISEEIAMSQGPNWKKSFLLILAGLVTSGYALLSQAQQQTMLDYYAEPGMYSNRDYINQHANEHIDPFTGKLQLHYVDVHLPGNGGFDLNVQRSYTSIDQSIGIVGHAGIGWTLHFGRVATRNKIAGTSAADWCNAGNFVSQAGNPVLDLPDGSRNAFYLPVPNSGIGNPQPLFITKSRWKAECITGGMKATSPEGVVFEMTQAFEIPLGASSFEYYLYATKITDRNGNRFEISYIPDSNAGVLKINSVQAFDSGSNTANRKVTFEYDSLA